MTGDEPSDAEIESNLSDMGKSYGLSWIKPNDHFKAGEQIRKGIYLFESIISNKQYWVATEVLATPSTLKIVTAIVDATIMVGDPLDWSVLLVDSTKRICNSFKCYSVPLYECLFTMLGARFPFSNFEVVVMNRLRVSPLKIHHGAWVYMKVFQFYVEHKSWKPSLDLFLISFT